MAAAAPPAEQATDLMQKLSLDSNKKTTEASKAGEKGPSAGQVVQPKSGSTQSPLYPDYKDPSMSYIAQYPTSTYYYGSYGNLVDPWADYSAYASRDGATSPGIYGGMYHQGYGYPSYGAYQSPASPVPTMQHDEQLYATQHYQYPSSFYHPQGTNKPAHPAKEPTPKEEASADSALPPVPADSSKLSSNAVNGSKTASGVPAPSNPPSYLPLNGSYNQSVVTNGHFSAYRTPRIGFGGSRSPVPWIGNAQQRTPVANPMLFSNAKNKTQGTPKMGSGVGQPTHGMINGVYDRMYGHGTNVLRPDLWFGSQLYGSGLNGCWNSGMNNKYKLRGRGYGSYSTETLGGLDELNRGPRADHHLNQQSSGSAVPVAAKSQSLVLPNKSDDESNSALTLNQYNRTDFPESYSNARFFVIKSYSEDDVHKSIKYNVWASTPNGNKKLDAAYQEAVGKSDVCPVFLFFSVNASGQFVGLAEMVGRVDFDKTVEHWQQDKWSGCFPVKWHIVKDVPNSLLKHIILENNENKPVTNSRDTQEVVRLEQGLQMIKIFKDHVCKTSILDDFSFYDNRENIMRDRKSKQQQLRKPNEEMQSDILESANKGGVGGTSLLEKCSNISDIEAWADQGRVQADDAVTAAAAGFIPMDTKSANKDVISEAVANGF